MAIVERAVVDQRGRGEQPRVERQRVQERLQRRAGLPRRGDAVDVAPPPTRSPLLPTYASTSPLALSSTTTAPSSHVAVGELGELVAQDARSAWRCRPASSVRRDALAGLQRAASRRGAARGSSAAAAGSRRRGRRPPARGSRRRAPPATPARRRRTRAGRRPSTRRVGPAQQRDQHRGLARVEPARASCRTARARPRVEPAQLAAVRREVEVGLEDLAPSLHCRSSASAICAWSHFWPERAPRPAARRARGRASPASCIVSVEPPRTRRPSSVRQTLSHAAPASPCQSTPWCSRKRRSSAAISASDSAGETSASGTQSRRRTRRSTRSSDSGTPWRSTSTRLRRHEGGAHAGEGRAASRRLRRRSDAPTGSERRPAMRSADPCRRSLSRLHQPIAAFGASPNISGAYIASTRVGGSSKRAGIVEAHRVLDDEAALGHVTVVARGSPRRCAPRTPATPCPAVARRPSAASSRRRGRGRAPWRRPGSGRSTTTQVMSACASTASRTRATSPRLQRPASSAAPASRCARSGSRSTAAP